jgi:hypothetical protein
MSSTPFQPSIRRALPVIAALALLLAVAGPVGAASPAGGRITRGDVGAAFQARTTGGYVNGLKGHTIAAPVRGLHDGRISFFGDSILCSTDWHYLAVTVLGTGSRHVAGAYLDQVEVTFAIDGAPVGGTMRTAIKPFVGTGIRQQLGVSVGKLVAPGSISDGDHALETQITTPDGGTQTIDATFTLAPDACAA